MTRQRANVILLACAAVWGFSYLFQKAAMAHIEPWLFVGARAAVAACVLAPLAWWELRHTSKPHDHSFWPLAALAGVLFLAASIVQQRGLVTASVTNTGFLTALYVVITPLLVWLVLARAPSPAVWGAVPLSFAGTWLLSGGGLSGLSGGDLLVLASSVLWAAHVVVLGMAAPLARPLMLMAVQFAIVAVLGLGGAACLEPIDHAALGRAAIDILYVGVLSSALTYTLLLMMMRYTSPTEAVVIASSETIFAALGGYLVLGERMSLMGACGGALILAAVLFVHLGPRRAASSA